MNSRYTKHVATILTFVFMAILYSDVLKKLALDWWNDPNYSHGFLIPFISVYWIWGRRKFLRAAQTDISVWGLPVLFASGILCFVHQKREKNLRFFMTYAASASSLVIVVNPWSISV
jgi:hypothetical protein